MSEFNGDLEALVQEKLESDNDFQSSLADLPDEDKNQLIADKKAEIIRQEFAATVEKAKKAEEIAKNQEIRAKKAEAEAKKPKDAPKQDMSLKDIRALNNVHDDDVDEVLDYAKFKGITPAEALKTPAIVAILKAKEEERKVAQATNTGGGKRGTIQKSDATILEEANQGKISEDDDDIAKLAEARFNVRKNRAR